MPELPSRPSRKVFAWMAIVTMLVAAYFALANAGMAASDDGLTRAFGLLYVGLAGAAFVLATGALVGLLRTQASAARPPVPIAFGILLTLYLTWLSMVGLPMLLIPAFLWMIATAALWWTSRSRADAIERADAD